MHIIKGIALQLLDIDRLDCMAATYTQMTNEQLLGGGGVHTIRSTS